MEALNFSMEGEFLTDLARSWYFDEKKDYCKSEELLLSVMGSTQDDTPDITDYKKQIALDIIEGRKKFIGLNHFELVDDVTVIRLVQVEELERKLNLMQKENKELTATAIVQQNRYDELYKDYIKVQEELDSVNSKVAEIAYKSSPVYRLRLHFGRSNFVDKFSFNLEILKGMKATDKENQFIAELCEKANIYPAWRNWGMEDLLSFYDKDTDKMLDASELIARGFAIKKEEDDEVNAEEPVKEEEEITEPQYGWLSPSGDFKISPWGTHEESAYDIIYAKGWEKEYNSWDVKGDRVRLARDFLVYVKGYVLLDNPVPLVGRPKATYNSDLTKKQRDFLYGYFLDLGNTAYAESFIKD